MGIPLAALEPGAASVLRRKHDREKRGGEIMIKLVPATITSMSFLMLLGPTPSLAAQQCADVESAKVALKSASVSSSRGQDGQSPRNQDIQSPRNQDVQSPRNQDIQSPRDGNVQQQRAAKLVNEAAAACNAGNTTLASQKAREAMRLLRK
jgi:hypothetical protein